MAFLSGGGNAFPRSRGNLRIAMEDLSERLSAVEQKLNQIKDYL